MLVAKRYELQEELGQGGMGIVYKAHDRLVQKPVALKRVNTSPPMLSFNSKTDDDMMMALAHEFRILAGLRHPNIIPVLDYGFDEEKRPFFTMQLLESPQAFFDAAQNVNFEQQMGFFVQLLQALSYLHQRGIIHRDLKPANVLIQNNQVHVLDFGLSVVADVARGRAGTVAYMAPEVVRHARATKQSDLFSVGVMLHKLITGKLPYSMAAMMRIDPFELESDEISDHPLELVILRLLSENPVDRYDSAQEVIHALCNAADMIAPVEDEQIRDSFLQAAPFIGRETEIATLENALETSINGQGSIWLVGGESGVGKSRLMEEIRVRALTEGAVVLRGQAIEGARLPYQIWRDPLRRLLLSTELDDLSASVLKEVIPDIASLLAKEIRAAPQLGGKAHHQRLISTITNLFQQQKRPILLILEDLQWASESLDPLKQLSQLIHNYPILIIGNYRDDEHANIPDIIPNTQALELKRLSEQEIEQLSMSMLGEAGAAPQVLDLLQRETEGNVFFLVEVVRALADAAGGRDVIGQVTLPQAVFAGGVQAVIKRRLSKVSQHDRHLLHLAAIAGRQIDSEVLEYTFHREYQLNHEAFDRFLLRCADAAILEIQEGYWQFSHDKLREQLLSELEDDDFIDYHRQIAEAIEFIYPDDIAQAEILLEHWYHAKNLAKEYMYLQQAAQYLINFADDYERAKTLLERSLENMDSHDKQRIKLLNYLSQANWNNADYDAAREAALLAQSVAQHHQDKGGIAESLLNRGWIKRLRGYYQDAATYYQNSLDIFRTVDEKRGTATSLNCLGVVTASLGNFDTAIAYYEESLAIQETLEDEWGVADNLNHIGRAKTAQGNYKAAINYYEQSLEIQKRIGDPKSIAHCLNSLGVVAFLQDNYQQANEYLQESLSIRQTIADSWGIAYSLNSLGAVAYLQHDFDGARDYYQQSLDIKKAIGNEQGVADSLGHLGQVAGMQGKYDLAISYLEESLVTLRKLGHQQAIAINLNNLGFVYLDKGHELAIPTLVEALRTAYTIGTQSYILESICGFIQLILQRGDSQRAARLAHMVQTHPAMNSFINMRLEPIWDTLNDIMDMNELEIVQANAQILDLETVIQELLDEFGEENQ